MQIRITDMGVIGLCLPGLNSVNFNETPPHTQCKGDPGQKHEVKLIVSLENPTLDPLSPVMEAPVPSACGDQGDIGQRQCSEGSYGSLLQTTLRLR